MSDYEETYFETDKRIDAPADARSWVQRTGRRSYAGHNDRGATVLMADPDDELPGSFSPGELLKLALAGCAGMTFDKVVARRLGDDFAATIVVTGESHATEDRYESFAEHIMVDAAGLDEAGLAGLTAIVRRAVAVGCTVGLTVGHGAPVDVFVHAAQ